MEMLSMRSTLSLIARTRVARGNSRRVHQGLRAGITVSVSACLMAFVGACGSDGPTVPTPNGDAATVLQSIMLSSHALILDSSGAHASYTLVATPLNGMNEPLLTSVKPTFVSRNPERIIVTSDGVITGRAPGDAGFVVASLTIDNQTVFDSVSVRVASGNATLTSLDLRPIPDTSLRIAVGATVRLNPIVTGTNIAGLEFYYTTSDPLVYVSAAVPENPYTNRIRMQRTGRAVLYVSTTVGGVTWTDSLVYAVGLGIIAQVSLVQRNVVGGAPVNEFSPSLMYLPLGGRVTFSGARSSALAYGIQFDKPDRAFPLVGSSANDNVQGNIQTFFNATGSFLDPGFSRGRRFLQPDTITFHSPEINATGKIIVVANDDCTPFCTDNSP